MNKRILAVVLALLMLITVLVSCKNGNTDDEGTDTEAPENIEIDISEYSIVYSKQASSSGKKKATELQGLLKDALSAELKVESDEEPQEQEKEILVGITNREQSADVYKKINGRGYAVAVSDKKIIITAYDADLLSAAFTYFVDTYIKNADGTKLTLPRALCYISKPLTTTDVIKNGTAIYSIIRSEQASYNITECAKSIYNIISQLTGVAVNLTTDYLKSGEAADSESFEILVGDTNRPETKHVKESLKANEYAVQKVGNKIVVIGSSESGTIKAKDAFIEIIYDSLGQTVDDKCDLLIKNDVYKSEVGNSVWLVDVPKFGGGKPGGVADISNNAYELYYTDTSADEFLAYCGTLEQDGYTRYDENEINGNLYRSYYKADKELVYTYYTAKDSSVRIIVSPFNDGLLPLSFESTSKVTEFSVTQLKLDYDNGGYGMTYIITLEDGSFIVIDGGSNGGSNADWLHKKLQELNKREGTPVIAAWYLTHIHEDHCAAFANFATRYGSQYILEYAIHNLPSKYTDFAYSEGQLSKFYENGTYQKAVNAFVGEAKVVRVHTGMKFNIHGAEFEVLYTWEDCYPKSIESQNDSSVVTRMTLAGKTFLWTGDIEKQASGIIIDNFGGYVKSDYLQLAHHGLANGGSWELYKTVDPTVAFWPTSNVIFNEQSKGNGPAGLLFKAGTVTEHIISEQGDKTIKF